MPRKNIREMHGRPLLAYSVEAALSSGLFARVVVSTDDAEIAAVARALGADVPFLRETALADDVTPVSRRRSTSWIAWRRLARRTAWSAN